MRSPTEALARWRARRHAPEISRRRDGAGTDVDRYWGEHTVNSKPFASERESLRYLEWRFEEYPLFRELSGLWGDHDGEVVLDYGCGPGNDLTGLAVHTGARKVIGADVSEKALALARDRLSLHRIDADRVELLLLSDDSSDTGLPDDSVDYAQSFGVLHHVSDPVACLRELRRVLKAGRPGRVMVYNRDSVWLHLYVAYAEMVLEGRFAGVTVEEAFAKTTDGPDCPIARCHRPAEFVELCAEAGFEAEFLGAYPSRHELDQLEAHLDAAKEDQRLAPEHRRFLTGLTWDADGNPLHEGKPAGVGGVYALR